MTAVTDQDHTEQAGNAVSRQSGESVDGGSRSRSP